MVGKNSICKRYYITAQRLSSGQCSGNDFWKRFDNCFTQRCKFNNRILDPIIDMSWYNMANILRWEDMADNLLRRLHMLRW